MFGHKSTSHHESIIILFGYKYQLVAFLGYFYQIFTRRSNCGSVILLCKGKAIIFTTRCYKYCRFNGLAKHSHLMDIRQELLIIITRDLLMTVNFELIFARTTRLIIYFYLVNKIKKECQRLYYSSNLYHWLQPVCGDQFLDLMEVYFRCASGLIIALSQFGLDIT